MNCGEAKRICLTSSNSYKYTYLQSAYRPHNTVLIIVKLNSETVYKPVDLGSFWYFGYGQ